MKKLTSDVVKQWAREMHANLVGIGSVDRWEGAPPGHGPNDFVKGAKSVIVFGVRIPDPVAEYDGYDLQWKEVEGDLAVQSIVEKFWYLMGEFVLDMTLNQMAVTIANRLEVDYGYRSCPTPDSGYTGLSSPAKPIPDHPIYGIPLDFFSQRHAAVRAGLGEFGLNNIVLTPQFGPRVRFGSIITRAEFEPDPLITKKICLRDKCGGIRGPICIEHCTGAIRLKDNANMDEMFYDTPSETSRGLCINMAEGRLVNECVKMGKCQRHCPIGQKVTKA